jgi:hypothetical protein
MTGAKLRAKSAQSKRKIALHDVLALTVALALCIAAPFVGGAA